jgi:hypothetical protein
VSTRLRSRLTWHPTAAAGLLKGGLLKEAAPGRVEFEAPVSAHERTVRLLHLGSEIEHALMVQYLYAAYSLDEDQPTDGHRALVREWKSVIAEIAREEMGHLATVQNILTLIGGPLCFEREDYPIVDPDLWPFPFELERLTRDSLGKYVLAEMPSDDVLELLGLTAEIDAIKLRLKWKAGVTVNRVGLIYGQILELFTEGPMIQGPIVPGAEPKRPFVAAADIQADSLPYQVSPNAWGLGYKQILIETAHDRTSALDALTKVSVQGEGPISVDDPDVGDEVHASHFWRFLEIYRKFPEEHAWSPSRHVATNPSTSADAPPDRRLGGDAAVWAELANLRYRMLLLYLQHSFYIETPTTHPTRSPRGALVTWAFGEMYHLRTLSEVLMGLPLHPGSRTMAGPPFEMPYSLSLPTRSAGRWRTHRDLLSASIELVDGMLADAKLGRSPVQERYLRAMRAADVTAQDQIAVLIGA